MDKLCRIIYVDQMYNVKKYKKYMKTQIYKLDVKRTLQSY